MNSIEFKMALMSYNFVAKLIFQRDFFLLCFFSPSLKNKYNFVIELPP